MSSGLLAGAMLSACISMENEKPEPKDVVIPAAEVPQAGEAPLQKQSERFFVIHNDDGLLAFSARCTHQSCNIGWEAGRDEFHCPCHGSIFNRHGERTAGPAPRPLDLLALAVGPDGGLVVTTGTATERDEWRPGQSVPLT
jgi:cytochrome b6-f complex iron-sulfur subunit